ncbi:hypothetical protein [Leptospira soteropolitanensis]|uniref:Uncharacterized protein n=1 Tax=Leptospira soteropolitanensis TaxID=2950025 RepID=A0AAW5VIN0_9LEPT|nr:hypothetical protein [Leptospira soteropolitanensis]MCW7502401.1 hypothetical protein [Leptospira soteropolitanensis]MCW7524639.1 hypothetical protein [Leptospira soteropolitanensis]MCW7532370.1 hypothetical protein [Leptospira soteropolitanensis]
MKDAAPGEKIINTSVGSFENLYFEENYLIIKATTNQSSVKNEKYNSEQLESCYKISNKLPNSKLFVNSSEFKLCKKREGNEYFENLDKNSELLFINDNLILKSESFKNIERYCRCSNFPSEKKILHVFVNPPETDFFKARYIFVFEDYTTYVIPIENEIKKINIEFYLKNISYLKLSEFIEEDCVVTGNCTFNSLKNYKKSEDFWVRNQNPFNKVKPQIVDNNQTYITILKESEYYDTLFPKSEIYKYKLDDNLFKNKFNIILFSDSKNTVSEPRKFYKYLKIPFTVAADIIITPIMITVSAFIWTFIAFSR